MMTAFSMHGNTRSSRYLREKTSQKGSFKYKIFHKLLHYVRSASELDLYSNIYKVMHFQPLASCTLIYCLNI